MIRSDLSRILLLKTSFSFSIKLVPEEFDLLMSAKICDESAAKIASKSKYSKDTVAKLNNPKNTTAKNDTIPRPLPRRGMIKRKIASVALQSLISVLSSSKSESHK